MVGLTTFIVSVREVTIINTEVGLTTFIVSVREDITINTEVGLTTFIQSLYLRIQQLILR